MLNWISQKCVSFFETVYVSAGCVPIVGEERDRLEELAGDDKPHEIWIDGETVIPMSRTICGHILIGRGDYDSFNQSEIEAVFLHEVGHIRDGAATYNSLGLMIGLVYLNLFVSMMLGVATGIVPPPSDVVVIVATICVVLFLILISLMVIKYEYRADEYATQKGYGEELISALQDYKNREMNIIHRMIMIYFPPTIGSRIERIRQNMDE